MDGDNVVLPDPTTVRRRPKKPRSKSFKGATYLFTSSISGYAIPLYRQKGMLEGDAVGLWDPETHEIAVTLPAPSPVAEADRVLHEYLHAASTIVLPPELRLNEYQVNAISTCIVDMLARNPELRTFLLTRMTPVEVTP
jgi:hypothetical protein